VSSIDSSLLLGFYQARSGQSTLASGSGASAGGKTRYAPTAPWATSSTAPRAPALVEKVMAGRRFVDENAAVLDLAGASTDYKKLFALFQGLNALSGLAERMGAKGVTDVEKARIQTVFAKGMAETTAYADSLKLEQMRLTRGAAMLSDRSTVGAPRANYTYTTGVLHNGTSTEAVDAFSGATVFDISIKKLNTTSTISVDLSEMTGTRSMSNVVSFINGKLSDAGVTTRFQVSRTAGEPKIVKTGTTTVTLPATGDDFALKVVGDSTETVSFSSSTAKPAVYLATTAGDPDPDDKATTKDAVYASSLTKTEAGASGQVGTKIFTNGLASTVSAVRASEIGSDGSVYMLAEVTGDTDGQTIKGATDVALLKYDSMGKLLFARTLGAVGEAKANALAISADGQVAIAGSITGQLEGATNGPINSGPNSTLSDSFVTLFDAKGDEVWTSRRGGLQADEATALAFGADGTVYVGGRSKSSIPGATSIGGWDGYLTALKADSLGKPQALFTQQFGTATDDGVKGIVVNGGEVIVGGMDDKHAVLRSFTVSGASATQSGIRDLGDLQGGTLAGLKLDGGQLYVGGSTRNAGLGVSNTTQAHAGGMDGFAARLSTDLGNTGSDALAYFGGADDDTVTAMAVANGKVWLTGLAGDTLPDGSPPIASQDGYLVEMDVAAGTTGSVQRITGKDGYVTPTALAVDTTGASALDRLGLPKGALSWTDSQKIVSATSARPGDQFQIRTREGGPLSTVTLAASDTLETLAAKVSRAAGFRAKVEVVVDGEFRRLKITPANDAATVEILPGKGGRDLLDSLGLAEGVVRLTKVENGRTVSASGNGNVYGLTLTNDLKLNSDDAIRNSQLVLSRALTAIRTAYKDLEAASRPASATSSAINGPVPTYLSNQISNYQAALDRLTGSG
jgi:hypothetical protein